MKLSEKAFEIAAEFNRREWRGRKDWHAYESSVSKIIYISCGLNALLISIEESNGLIAGWRSQEELAALKAEITQVVAHTEEDGEVCRADCLGCIDPVRELLLERDGYRRESFERGRELAALKANLDAMVAENHRLQHALFC